MEDNPQFTENKEYQPIESEEIKEKLMTRQAVRVALLLMAVLVPIIIIILLNN